MISELRSQSKTKRVAIRRLALFNAFLELVDDEYQPATKYTDNNILLLISACCLSERKATSQGNYWICRANCSKLYGLQLRLSTFKNKCRIADSSGKLSSPGHNQNWIYGDVIRKVNMAAKAGHTIFSHF